jgi:hypothetical protein
MAEENEKILHLGADINRELVERFRFQTAERRFFK